MGPIGSTIFAFIGYKQTDNRSIYIDKYEIFSINLLLLSMKCSFYEKCPVHGISYLWNVLSMECPSMESSVYGMSYLRIVLTMMECPIYEMSCL